MAGDQDSNSGFSSTLLSKSIDEDDIQEFVYTCMGYPYITIIVGKEENSKKVEYLMYNFNGKEYKKLKDAIKEFKEWEKSKKRKRL